MSKKTKNSFDPYDWSKKRINTLVSKIHTIKNDGLSLSPGQIWSLKKLLFLDYYARAFVTIIRKHDFENWYYVDTHAGTGLIGFEEQDLIKERFPGSPLIAAFRSPEYVFTHYFFSDIDDNSIISLQKRLQSVKPLTGVIDYTTQTMDFKKTVEFIENKKKFGNAFLIFVDPKGYSEIKWELMKKLLSISTADIIFTFMTYSIAFNKETALENYTTAQSISDFFGNDNWKTCKDGNALVNSDKEFISLGDVELTNDRIRAELVRHLDDQFEGVIAQDIVGPESGASKVNKMVPQNLWGKKLGTRAATAIFMYSHSGAVISQGATEAEIKRATVSRGIYSAQISEVLNHFRNQLLFLNIQDGKYMFTKEANILKMKIDRMENIKSREMDEVEKQLLKNNTSNNRFKVIVWPSSPKDVENSHSLKLVILKENDWKFVENIYDTIGESPRIYKNNIFILVPSDGEKNKFSNSLKSKIAWEHIDSDKFIKLKDEQKHTLQKELDKENNNLKDYVKEYYSTIYVPEKNSPTKHHISIPLSSSNTIDEIVYDYLKQELLVNEQLGPILLKTQYLRDSQHVDTSILYETMLRTPGERRPVSKQVLEEAIRDGVFKEEFGLGELEDEKPICKYFGNKEYPKISFDPGEVIILAKLCKIQAEEGIEEFQCDVCAYKTNNIPELENHKKTHVIIDIKKEIVNLSFSFSVPEGTINYTSGMFLSIAEKFKQFRLAITASDGKMSKQDIENLKETLRQMGADSDLFDQFRE